jgi:hypothetical protein
MACGVVLALAFMVGGVALPALAGPEPPPVDPYDPHIDPADFVAVIDNPYLPLAPGTTYTYEGSLKAAGERNIVSVTNRTKRIIGVTTTVVNDVVTVEGVIAEKTLDWYAQDRWGNVWYFGEDSKSYENGKVVSTEGSWEAGVDGAKPGIVMLGQPHVGDLYRQEYYPGVAEDMAQVLQLDASVTVPYGSFTDVLVTKDWTPLDPKVVENKYFAPGVGLVLERSAKGPKEESRLVSVVHN